MSKDVALAAISSPLIFAMGDVMAQRMETTRCQNEKEEGERLEFKAASLNLERTMVVGSQGLLLNGLMLPVFYRGLDHWFGDTTKQANWRMGVAKKILATQVVYMPVSTALFLLVTPLLEVLVGTAGRRGGWGAVSSSPSSPSSSISSPRSSPSSSPTPSSSSSSSPLSSQIEGQTETTWRGSLETGLEKGLADLRGGFWHCYLTSWWFWPISDAINFRLIPLSYRPLWDSVIDIVWTSFMSDAAHPASASEEQKSGQQNERTAAEAVRKGLPDDSRTATARPSQSEGGSAIPWPLWESWQDPNGRPSFWIRLFQYVQKVRTDTK
uniref:Mpv17/PMP22 family protein n=1 Tax=Chromera velia CCMP2878 TaxID=1169474 RepID=A0A0G4H952_9ALVE|eukprot:Cvel_25216.t1-p1 / transcript=Cvel_25216.t1 / gene=Cvel_25216 / organism=Chromera_velia_CCMP2878 / gene_product=hypothetical protein / transcript_product=hypothetical protein / location=Cvel_scaffold2827:9110-11671(+) / protein_length=324 / sequence_SO=supercontig / SO=protein_coding / is_pseudo=false